MEENNEQLSKIIDQISAFESYIAKLILDHGANLDIHNRISLPSEVIASFSQKKNSFYIDIIKLLCISVLCGEYIEIKDFFNKLEKLEKRIEELPNETYDLPLDIQSQIFDISSAITLVIEFYKDFFKKIENYYSEDRIQFVFKRNTLIQRKLNNGSFHPETAEKIKYFLNLLKITSIDHFPSTGDNHIFEVFNSEEFIEDFTDPRFRDISNVICEKITFLKFKWKERRLQENPFMHSYLENGIEKKIGEYSTPSSELSNWKEIINTQYEIKNSWKADLSERVKSYKNNSISSFNECFKLHQLIKYFKDVNPLDKKLQEISLKLLEKRQNNSCSNFYDKYAENIFCNYALNNEFSHYIENESSIEKINLKYDEINSKLNDTTNNYFLKFRYLNRVLDILMPKINDIDKESFIKNYSDSLDKCKSILNQYHENIKWSLINFNYVFILPINESKVKFEIDGSNYNVLFASSFTLPPSSKKIEEDYNIVKEKFDKLYSYLGFSKYFFKEINEINHIKNELKDKEIKSLELLSLFTAVISFIIGGVSGFAYIKDLYTALLFFVVFTTSLLTFLIALFVFTRGLKIVKKNLAFLIALYIIFLFAIGSLSLNNFIKLKFLNNKSDIEKIEEKLKNDSIKNLKKDFNIQNTHPIKIEVDTRSTPKTNGT